MESRVHQASCVWIITLCVTLEFVSVHRYIISHSATDHSVVSIYAIVN